MREDATETRHESYGKVSINRNQGEQNLVGAPWPTGHFMTLTISDAVRVEDSMNENYMSGREIIKIALSEVQFAQMITGIGTEGVPCTIQRRWVDGKYVGMAAPPSDAQSDEDARAAKAIQADATSALQATQDALDMARAMLSGGAPKKSDLRDLEDKLRTALREATANLPYVVERASEAAIDMRERAKAEVEAYFGFAKQRLGEEALALAAERAVALGHDPAQGLLSALGDKDAHDPT